MISRKEVYSLFIAVLILGFVASWSALNSLSFNSFVIACFMMLIIIVINVYVKKFSASNLDVHSKVSFWFLQRYGLGKGSYFKNKIPFGLILPFIIIFLSGGMIPWYASLESHETPLKSRVAKRKNKFFEISEKECGKIASSGIYANLLFGLLAFLAGFPILAKLSVQYALFNLIPIGRLDGSKIFFSGSGKWLSIFITALITFLIVIL